MNFLSEIIQTISFLNSNQKNANPKWAYNPKIQIHRSFIRMFLLSCCANGYELNKLEKYIQIEN